MPEHVATAPHELEGHLIYTQYGLDPYWLLSRWCTSRTDGGASLSTELSLDGGPESEEWDIALKYEQSGIAPRPEDAIDSETCYEFRINCYGYSERKASFLVHPRWDGMEEPDGSTISTSFEGGITAARGEGTVHEGVDVEIDGGSNLEPEEYTQLLPQALEALADHLDDSISPYFRDDPHPQSNIYTFERYVRVRRDIAGKLLEAGGPWRSLFDLLADREGSKVMYAADNSEIVGYKHRLQFDSDAACELVRGHRLGKQLKYYFPQHPRNFEPEDVMYHPKVGVAFRKKWNGHAVRWHEHEQLSEELEETVANLLSWGEVPVDPDPTTFVADDHFSVGASDRDIAFVDDPSPEVEVQQETKIVRVFNQHLTDSDEQLLREVATDGGHHYRESGLPPSTLYDCLDRLDGILESEDGIVRFVSEHIREKVSDALERFERVIDSTAKVVADLLDLDRETIRQKGGAFDRFLAEYGAQLVEADHREKLKVGVELTRSNAQNRKRGIPLLKDVLKQLRHSWSYTGRPPSERKEIVFEATVDGEQLSVPMRILESYKTNVGLH